MKRHYLAKILRLPLIPITIDLVGAGGTGSQVLINLARIHISLVQMNHKGFIVNVFDPDKVEPHNIGRQQFYSSDVGRFKSDVLVERVNRTFGLGWHSHTHLYKSNNEYMNIIISCVDTGKARREIEEVFKKQFRDGSDNEYNTYYWLDFGNSRNSGQVVMGSCIVRQPESAKYELVNKMKTILDIFPDIEKYDTVDQQGESCSTFVNSLQKQDLFINTIIASHGCKFLWQFLTNTYTDHQGLFYNGGSEILNPILL